MSDEKETPTLSVIIMTPTEELWSGQAKAISSVNNDGPFDILPGHANFITLVQGVPVTVTTGEGKEEYSFNKAVISAKENLVRVYGNI